MMNVTEMEAKDTITGLVQRLDLLLSNQDELENIGPSINEALLRIEQLACQSHDDVISLLALVMRIMANLSVDWRQGHLTDGKEAGYLAGMVSKSLAYMLRNPPLEPSKRMH